MKTKLLYMHAMAGAMLLCLSACSRGQAPRGGQARVVSPEVQPDRHVALRIAAPRAETVRLNASDVPGGAQAALKKGDDGVWEVVLGPVDPGAYRYTFVVDGVPTVDPRNPATSESNGNTWSLFVVP